MKNWKDVSEPQEKAVIPVRNSVIGICPRCHEAVLEMEAHHAFLSESSGGWKVRHNNCVSLDNPLTCFVRGGGAAYHAGRK